MSTVWLVIPTAKEGAFRSLYQSKGIRGKDSPNEDETVGVMQPNADGTKLFTDTSRLNQTKRQALLADSVPWLETYDTWPPPGGWEYPST